MVRSLRHPDVSFIMALPRGRGEDAGSRPTEKLSEESLKTVRDQLAMKAANPYHRILIPDANTIKISSVREIRRTAVMSTYGKHKRVIIISRAEDMKEDAANALLKTLEEPATDTVFVLTSSNPDSLPPTIRSRCQSIRFEPLTPEAVRDALIARNNLDRTRAELISRIALGSYGRALELMDENLDQERAEALEFVRLALGYGFLRRIGQIEGLARDHEREELVRFLNLLMIWFRDALVMREGGRIINVDQQQDVERFCGKFPDADIHGVLGTIDDAIRMINRYMNPTIVLLQLSIRIRDIILRMHHQSSQFHPVGTPS
jgi:DNA polymerase-3 subunit delta'